MVKNILKILIIFIVGSVGGIFASQIFWPYSVERPLSFKYGLGQTPVYLTETKEIYIQENVALVDLVERMQKTIVAVKTQTGAGRTLQGSGLIITSDGLVVTLAELVPQGSDFTFFVNGKSFPYQILKRDLEQNLALIKISDSTFNTASFARLEQLKIGERVFLIGAIFEKEIVLKTVNEGIVKTFNQNLIQTNISESNLLSGSPLFNIQGEVLGLSVIDAKGNVNAIPISKIRDFVGM